MADPLYKRIYSDLLGKIENGTYAPGSLIPGEVELADVYGVSRPTARQAVQMLADQGHVERRKRRGTIVCRPKVRQSFAERLTSFANSLEGSPVETSTRVLALREEPASEEVARALELEEDALVACLVRLRSVDGDPTVLLRTYVPAGLYPGLLDRDFEQERLYEVFTQLGDPIATAQRTMDVCMPDPLTAALLDIDVAQPCFLFHTVGRAADGAAVEYSVATYRGDTNSFTVSVSVEG